MSVMWLFTAGFGVLFVLGYACGIRLRTEYRLRREPTYLTVGMVWALYSIHFILVLVAALYAIWPLPLPRPLSIVGGTLVITIGMAIYFASVVAFRSLKRLSGLNAGQLVTSGMYRWSRNPQYVGWMLVLVGIALLRASGMVLLLAALYWISFVMYLPLEENLLEQLHGDAYRKYCTRTRRYLGPPKGG